jgi:hypothetical protein
MMDSFYQAMSEIDIHHRGLPTQEDGKMYGLTRPSGYREEYASKLGSIECKMAKLLTAGILPVSENSLVVVNKK